MQANCVVGKSVGAVTSRYFATQDRSHRAIDVANRKRGRNRGLPFQGRLAKSKERGVIQRFFQSVVLRNSTMPINGLRHVRSIKNLGEVEPVRLPMFSGAAFLNAIGAAYHFLELVKTQLCHQLADFLRDEIHEVHHV